MSQPILLLAPAAGAPSTHPWMQRWKERLQTFGSVTLFDYPYMREGRRRPDPLPQLIAAHREALTKAKRGATTPTILIGKSMGSRIGCHVALEENVDAIICLGYPLCAGGDRRKLRDQVLHALSTPILFVQGTRDSLCPLDILEEVRSAMKAPNTVHLVQDGDHSLLVTKRYLRATDQTQNDVDQKILDAIGGVIDQLKGT